jgi:hypothetical protein
MNLTNQIPQNVRRRAPAVGHATFEFSPFDQDVPMQIGLPDGHVDFLDALETTVAATLGAFSRPGKYRERPRFTQRLHPRRHAESLPTPRQGPTQLERLSKNTKGPTYSTRER